MLCTTLLGHCALHCSAQPFRAVFCTASLHCLFKAVLCTAPLCCGRHCLSGAVPCTTPLGHCVLHYPSRALCIALLSTTLPGLCSALPLWGYALHCLRCCTLYCPSRAVLCPSGALCSAPTILAFLGTVFLHYPTVALCSALPLWATLLCTTPLGLCSSLPPWPL